METTTTPHPTTGFDPFSLYLNDRQQDARHVDRQLVAQAELIIDKMQRPLKNVAAGDSVNSLGELQASGVELDRLCALREAARMELQRLQGLHDRMFGMRIEEGL